jgi:S-adenosylmethionine:tRNA ribosyltransferase-isomerase
LLVLDRRQKDISHRRFRDLPQLLHPGDALVLNRTRVIPARLFGRKRESGGKVEILLLREVSEYEWLAMLKGKRLRQGTEISISEGLVATVLEELEGPQRHITFNRSPWPTIESLGQMPLPPYITQELGDADDYQTVYADRPGSAAAPTAGLHFTPRLLDETAQRGLELIFVTLHVGLDTFAPVHDADPSQHPIHSEWCQLTREAADRINRVRTAGSRVVAVGTTTVRTLETAARQAASHHALTPYQGPTELFILPGHQFRAVDALVTNFHLPRSTLLMLVSAFAGRRTVLDAYMRAIAAGYRFYSFGDAMLIL